MRALPVVLPYRKRRDPEAFYRETMMLRHHYIQQLLDLFANPRYLEVGVSTGETFVNVRAAERVGVDPQFAFDYKAYSSDNADCSLVNAYSDEYFSSAISSRKEKFDLIFLDGLHTFEQIVKDLLNALQLIATDGIIIIDDVIPSDYIASVGDVPTMLALRQAAGTTDRSWMGDVFKVVWFVATYLPFLSFATIRENHGQMVVWRDKSGSLPANETMKNITSKEYKDVILSQGIFRIKSFKEIMRDLEERPSRSNHSR